MARKVTSTTFRHEVERQLMSLRDPDYAYEGLLVYVAGIPEPWKFVAADELEFHEDTGVLVARDGPTDENGHDNAEVPEHVFRLDAIVATQLV
jgi:hypothetical protein